MIKRILILLLTILTATVSVIIPVSAIDDQFWADSNIIFYNPKNSGCIPGGGGSLSGSPGSLTGGTNEEKVWNYLTGRGLTAISAAGVMGNMVQENSSFDPWLGENGNNSIDKTVLGVGFGIIQWTNTGGNTQGRRYGVMKYLEDNGVRLDATDPSQNDLALKLELDWLWDGEYGQETWQGPLNNETTVDGDASRPSSESNVGNGSTLLFHALIERSADGIAGKQERIDSAKAYLDKYGSSNFSGCGGDGDWGDPDSLIAAFKAQVGTGGYTMPNGYVYGHCTHGCTTLSAWFISEYTTLTHGGGNGGQVASNLASANGIPLTDSPEPPAIFSSTEGNWYATDYRGHTGLVVKVEGSKATVIHTWAAICSTGPQIDTFEIPYNSSKVNFVNVGPYLK